MENRKEHKSKGQFQEKPPLPVNREKLQAYVLGMLLTISHHFLTDATDLSHQFFRA
jgi:hypothetical protein